MSIEDALFKRLTAESRARAAACRRGHFAAWRVEVRYGNYSAFNGGHFTPSDYSALRCGTCGRYWRTNAAYVAQVPDDTRGEITRNAAALDAAASAVRQFGQVPPGHPDAARPVPWGQHPRDCDCGDCP